MATITLAEVRALLGQRNATSHKGDHGRALLLAGSPGFSGAAVMAAAAALRGGVGTLRVLCPAQIQPAFYALPEAMVQTFAGGWDDLPQACLAACLSGADCVAIGPGIGQAEGILTAVEAALASGKPMVIDADGLNRLSKRPNKDCLHKNAVLTPHPGEMARLTGLPIETVLADPQACAQHYAGVWGCIVLLKGAQSVIAAPDGRCRQNSTGNAGLTKGGSGDVLTGLILALLGQKLAPFDAACAGAYLLGASADEAVSLLGTRMLMARDVLDMVRITLEQTLGGCET